MAKSPTLTVAVPTYNRLDLLKRTLESVLNQKVPPDEIIVVDDGSEKGVIEHLKSLKGIKLIRNKKNLGAFENINECFKKAKSDYVVVCGSDDLLLPNCIKVYKEKMAKHGNKPAVYLSAGYIIDANDKITGIVSHFAKDIYLKPPDTVRKFWDSYKFHLLIGGWSAWRKDIFKEVGYFGRKYGRAGENEMTMKILPHYPIFYTPEVLFAYRFHAMQGLEGQAKNAGVERGIDEAKDGARVLWDFENDSAIKKAFTKKEQKMQFFIRRPLSFFPAISLFYFLTGQKVKAQKLLGVFRETYPPPIISFLTFKLLSGWFIKLTKDYLTNYLIRLQLGDKKVLEIS